MIVAELQHAGKVRSYWTLWLVYQSLITESVSVSNIVHHDQGVSWQGRYITLFQDQSAKNKLGKFGATKAV